MLFELNLYIQTLIQDQTDFNHAGLMYTGDKLGINVMYNKAGQKTYIVSSALDQIEYEMPRGQLDVQIDYNS